MASPVTKFPAAPPAEALAHFEARLRLEAAEMPCRENRARRNAVEHPRAPIQTRSEQIVIACATSDPTRRSA